MTRMWNVCESVVLDYSGDKNVFWLRMNPNTPFRVGNARHNPSGNERSDAVVAWIDSLVGMPDDPPMRVGYAFFQSDATGRPERIDDSSYHSRVRECAVQISPAADPLKLHAPAPPAPRRWSRTKFLSLDAKKTVTS